MKLKPLALSIVAAMMYVSVPAYAVANVDTDTTYFGSITAEDDFSGFAGISDSYDSFEHLFKFTLVGSPFEVTGNAQVLFSYRPSGTVRYGIENFAIYAKNDAIGPEITLLAPNSGLSQFTGSMLLAPGSYTYRITGDVTGDLGGKYSYNVTAVPVPEPETWAMLVAGLGLVGLQLRRRTNTSNKLSIN